MSLKIWNITKANARVDDLEAQVASLLSENAVLKAASVSEAENYKAIEAAAEKAGTDLKAARLEIDSLKVSLFASETNLDVVKAELATKLQAAQAEAAANLAKAASVKAAEIVAGQSVPAVASTVSATPAAPVNPIAALHGLDKVEAAFKAGQHSQK